MCVAAMLVAPVLVSLIQCQGGDATAPPVTDWHSYSDSKEQRNLEYEVSRELYGALDVWIEKRGAEQAAACEELVERLLTRGEPSIEAYYLAAKTYELLGRSARTTTILQELLVKRPDGKAPGFQLPVQVCVNIWLGRLYREASQGPRAAEAFAAAATAVSGRRGAEHIWVLCKLYLAEVQAEMLGDETGAEETLASAAQAMSTVSSAAPNPAAFFAEWARQKLEVAKGNSREKLGCPPEYFPLATPLIHQQLALTGVLAEPRADFYGGRANERARLYRLSIERGLESAKGGTDTQGLGLIRGQCYMAAKDYAKAESAFSELRSASCYVSPMAGIEEARCEFAQGKQEEAWATLDAVKGNWPSYEELATRVRSAPGFGTSDGE